MVVVGFGSSVEFSSTVRPSQPSSSFVWYPIAYTLSLSDSYQLLVFCAVGPLFDFLPLLYAHLGLLLCHFRHFICMLGYFTHRSSSCSIIRDLLLCHFHLNYAVGSPFDLLLVLYLPLGLALLSLSPHLCEVGLPQTSCRLIFIWKLRPCQLRGRLFVLHHLGLFPTQLAHWSSSCAPSSLVGLFRPPSDLFVSIFFLTVVRFSQDLLFYSTCRLPNPLLFHRGERREVGFPLGGLLTSILFLCTNLFIFIWGSYP